MAPCDLQRERVSVASSQVAVKLLPGVSALGEDLHILHLFIFSIGLAVG
jgi:hypothetical protein